MSYRSCNYCLHKQVVKNLKSDERIVKRPGDFGLGGVSVYVVPKGVKLTDENKDQFDHSWYMELPKHCAC